MIQTRQVEYSYGGGPRIVIREGGKIVRQLEAEAVHGDETRAGDAVMTGDYDYYRPSDRFERYTPAPASGDSRRIEYTLDGDPEVVVRRAGRDVQRMPAQSSQSYGSDSVYTADGDCYRPQSPPKTINGYDP